MQQPLSKILLLCIPILLFITSFTPVFAYQDKTTYIDHFHMWYVHEGKKKPVPISSGVRLEVDKMLNQVDHLAGLSSFQLPTKYILIEFDHPVILSTFSPIKHPIQSMIITIPQHKLDLARLLIRNSQRSWIEYHTNRSLSIFIQQITPSSIRDEGVIC